MRSILILVSLIAFTSCFVNMTMALVDAPRRDDMVKVIQQQTESSDNQSDGSSSQPPSKALFAAGRLNPSNANVISSQHSKIIVPPSVTKTSPLDTVFDPRYVKLMIATRARENIHTDRDTAGTVPQPLNDRSTSFSFTRCEIWDRASRVAGQTQVSARLNYQDVITFNYVTAHEKNGNTENTNGSVLNLWNLSYTTKSLSAVWRDDGQFLGADVAGDKVSGISRAFFFWSLTDETQGWRLNAVPEYTTVLLSGQLSIGDGTDDYCGRYLRPVTEVNQFQWSLFLTGHEPTPTTVLLDSGVFQVRSDIDRPGRVVMRGSLQLKNDIHVNNFKSPAYISLLINRSVVTIGEDESNISSGGATRHDFNDDPSFIVSICDKNIIVNMIRPPKNVDDV